MARPVVELGLVMAGAVSAGAYTAGVLDFLIEALDQWEVHKKTRSAAAPPHDVVLRVATGTSAGGINAAILATAVDASFPPARDLERDGPGNPFFSPWADAVDAENLLSLNDLKDSKSPVVSLFDSSCLEPIADRVLSYAGQGARRSYLGNPLDIILTLTNLRGVPYNIDLIGGALGEDRPAGYEMISHADYVRFSIGRAQHPDSVLLAGAARATPAWQLLRDAALATSAFPGALAPRRLSRPASAYTTRLWRVPRDETQSHDGPCFSLRPIEPSWDLAPEDQFEFLSVDGGVLNNEPLELARQVLEEKRQHDAPAAHAIVLIDPFPRTMRFTNTYEPPEGLAGVLVNLLTTLRAQAGFKPEELALAFDRSVNTRYLIAPRRAARNGTLLPYPLAGGALDGFAGFLERAFRVHDFLLGRRNAQRFLERHLALPAHHAVVADWTDAMDRAHGVWPTGVAPDGRAPFRPLIPLFGSARNECPLPDWPQINEATLVRLTELVERRLAAVLPRLTRQYFGRGAFARLASLAIGGHKADAARRFRDYVQRELEARGQVRPKDRSILGRLSPRSRR